MTMFYSPIVNSKPVIKNRVFPFVNRLFFETKRNVLNRRFRNPKSGALATQQNCCNLHSGEPSDSPIVALSLRSFSGSAPLPESVQNDSMICAAIRFAAAISFVPVLRNTTRCKPLIAGGVNRSANHSGRVGEDADKSSALCIGRG
jgi:hypothetical protein